MGESNTLIRWKVTESQYINQMPIVNGQVIVLSDKPEMYYDMNDVRHQVADKRWETYSPS